MPTTLNALAPGQPYDPYWKRVICADRAGLTLRGDFREHVAQTVRDCGFHSIRQHGVFHDDMFVWFKHNTPHVQKPGKCDGEFNFQYVFSNYDYYLSVGVRPFVELSFVPAWMASKPDTGWAVNMHPTPPKDYNDWRKIVRTTIKALVDRYGIDEIRSWNFEVWNEPNIPFWLGTQEEYFELYRASAEAVKEVDQKLRIGGPATANFTFDEKLKQFRPCWVEDFITWCDPRKIPIDFISTHPYPTNFPFDEGTKTYTPMAREPMATLTDLTLLRKIVNESPYKHAAIHCNEWGSSPGCRDRSHDHVFGGTFVLENVLRCIGLVDSLAHWCLSDVSEEVVPGPQELHGGWGIQTVHGLKKPAYHAYAFLNRCGANLLHNDPDRGVAVFRGDHGWQVLFYNHHPYAYEKATWETIDEIEQMIGPDGPRSFHVTLENLPPRVRVTRRLVDREHGWVQKGWVEMGQPDWPTARQLTALRDASEPALRLTTHVTDAGRLDLRESLSGLGMILLEIERV